MKHDIVNQILDVTQELLMVQGYNAISYADISERIGITKASIHYYFPGKSDLAKEIMARYRTNLNGFLAQIDAQETKAYPKLARYIDLYLGLLPNADTLCLCAILAADFPTLPAPVQVEVKQFYTENEAWLAKVLQAGLTEEVFQLNQSVQIEAQLLLAGLQGAMLNARAFGDIERFRVMAQKLLQSLTKPAAS